MAGYSKRTGDSWRYGRLAMAQMLHGSSNWNYRRTHLRDARRASNGAPFVVDAASGRATATSIFGVHAAVARAGAAATRAMEMIAA